MKYFFIDNIHIIYEGMRERERVREKLTLMIGAPLKGK